MPKFDLQRGKAPLLVSLPHDGTELIETLRGRLTPAAQRLPDTDWHVGRLYNFARKLGASILRARYSRYVVDLNRPPDGASLYPGQNTTGLCPTVLFDGTPVYREDEEPTPEEIAERTENYWQPYHQALAEEIARIKAQHGRAVLWDCHSIRSVVPFLFEGRLPDFNLGTASGASCSPSLQAKLGAVLDSHKHYTSVVNGRFKGGYITRQYGRPKENVDAVQLELAQCIYMDEVSFVYDSEKATPVQAVIRGMLEACVARS